MQRRLRNSLTFKSDRPVESFFFELVIHSNRLASLQQLPKAFDVYPTGGPRCRPHLGIVNSGDPLV